MSRSNAISNSSSSRSRLPSKYCCFVGGESRNTIEANRPLSCHYIVPVYYQQSKDTPPLNNWQVLTDSSSLSSPPCLHSLFTGRAPLIRRLLRLMKTFNISLSRVNYLIWVALDLSALLPTTINTANNLLIFPLEFVSFDQLLLNY